MQRRIKMAATAVLIVSALLLIISLATSRQNRTIFGTGLGGDWLAFYNAADILNHHSPARLYDLQLQSQLYHEQLPGELPQACLPYANAPFLADAFRSLALIPYAWSFAIWTALSILMFIAGLSLAWRAADLPRENFGFGLLLCLSFEPLAIECIHGGQISAIAMLLICGAIHFHLSRRELLAGAILSLCIYKPTLLPIILLMLLASRQWRVLGGFFIGAVGIVVLSCAMLGVSPWMDYLHMLLQYAGVSTSTSGEMIFRTWKFIDLNSFLKLLHLPPSAIALVFSVIAVIAGRVAMEFKQIDFSDPDRLRAAWACALVSTLVLNIYVGIYDSVLVLPALLLMWGILLKQKADMSHFGIMAATIYLLPWVSQIFAYEMGVQVYSLGLILLMAFSYRMLHGNRHLSSSVPPLAIETSR